LLQTRNPIAEFLQRRSLITSTLLQFLDVSQDRPKQRRLPASVKFRRVALQDICGTRGRLDAGLKVVKVGVDAGHPISEIHAKISRHTIRLARVTLNLRIEPLRQYLSRSGSTLAGNSDEAFVSV
jgi:hypothetical protein